MNKFELYMNDKLVSASVDDDRSVKIGDGFLVHGKTVYDGVTYDVLSDGHGNYKLALPQRQVSDARYTECGNCGRVLLVGEGCGLC